MRKNRQVQSALAFFPTTSGRQWHMFEDLVENISAWEMTEVTDALARAEEAASEGYWVVGMVSYDAGPAFDNAICSHRNDSVPLAAFGVFRQPSIVEVPTGGIYQISAWESSQTQAQFEESVRKIKDPIRSGDSYQVNHTMRLKAKFGGDSRGLFARMVRAQQAKHSVYIDLGDAAICSASPELFFYRTGQSITTRPMKGTRPRSPDQSADLALAAELTTSDKDRAENTMIVDMARNDLGRIATVGSIGVPLLHEVETYPTLHQMTSTVTAETDASLVDTFRALFPAASITGAPKFSTSRLIKDFEPSPRGIYTGAIGVISPYDQTEFNVSIRTAWIDRTTQTAEYGVGCGIVWDSDPTTEWHEARQKTAVLTRCQTNFGLLETMRWTPDAGIIQFDAHMSRLKATANHFGFECDSQEISNKLKSITGTSDLRVRLIVDEFGSPDIELTPIEPLDRANSSDTIPTHTKPVLPFVGLDSEPVLPTNEFLYHKTTDRRRYNDAKDRQSERLRRGGKNNVDRDVLLWNERGELTESATGNLVVEVDGAFLTPALRSGLLPGTFRHRLLELGMVAESTIDIDILRRSDRVFVVNSVRGWTEVAVDYSYVPDDLDPTSSTGPLSAG